MKRRRDKDEYLEQLWYMQEDKKNSLDELKRAMGENFKEDSFKELLNDGSVTLRDEGKNVSFTETGEKNARQIIISGQAVSDL